MTQRIVALAGGVGGAKLAHGLQMALDDPTMMTVIINTADDFQLYGLHISPDIDTVMYTLAGLANTATGWGVRDDTFTTLTMMSQYGEDPWFQLGDRDFATHILRTRALRAGTTLTVATTSLARALGITPTLLPMTDDPVATLIDTPGGRLDFQDYFVARRHADIVTDVVLDGIAAARPSPAALDALSTAGAVIICPSNPIVSIGPILAVPGLRDAVESASGPLIVVSPIVGGEALKGPAALMMEGLGHEVSALGVARMYAGLATGIVIDAVDSALAPAIEALGMQALVTDAIMRDDAGRERLAREVLDFATTLAAARAGAR